MGEHKKTFRTDLANLYCCTDLSVSKLLKGVSVRLRRFTIDAYAGSNRFSGPGPSQIWSCMRKKSSQFRQELKGVVYCGSDIFEGCLSIEFLA